METLWLTCQQFFLQWGIGQRVINHHVNESNSFCSTTSQWTWKYLWRHKLHHREKFRNAGLYAIQYNNNRLAYRQILYLLESSAAYRLRMQGPEKPENIVRIVASKTEISTCCRQCSPSKHSPWYHFPGQTWLNSSLHRICTYIINLWEITSFSLRKPVSSRPSISIKHTLEWSFQKQCMWVKLRHHLQNYMRFYIWRVSLVAHANKKKEKRVETETV